MAVKSYSELVEQVKAILKDNNSDEALGLLEDLADSEPNMAGKKYQYDEDMEAKVSALDTEWRERYKKRFYTGEGIGEPAPASISEPEQADDEDDIHVKDLFKEVK